ncbi:quercetin dioxygenase-like cupin family protein [Caldalkalibacillus uzonensis]|uniref:Quercetin dioxygenase-like cupin family protein n=1 Tax=Caldalkalibacillus uzonensis TaxID=353224 RepID=A0ABU0CQR9_9BACI|nr:quercetin dioxygenase-like cupin family protein [Caldalkalibacillus uzonensis]
MSEKTGLSVSFLSQVERGSTSLAITSLKKIADAFNVPITHFFESFTNANFKVAAEEQKAFRIEGSSSEYIRLAGEFSGRQLEPLLVTLSPGQKQDNVFSHPGEEFYFVLDGVVIFNIDGKEYIVKAGESIHFPSNLPHFVLNPVNQSSSMLCVLTPVIF